MTSRKFCPECGEDIDGDPRFCRSCGFDLSGARAAEAPTTEARAPAPPPPPPRAPAGSAEAEESDRRRTMIMVGGGVGALVVVILVLVLVAGVFSGDDGDPGASGGEVSLSEIQAEVDAGSDQAGSFFDQPESDPGTAGGAGQSSGANNPPDSSQSQSKAAFEPTGPPASSNEQTFTSGTHSCPSGSDVVVGPVTSCGFADAVAQSYRQLPASSRGQSFSVFSPTTGETYEMACSGSNPVKCTGGNDASVYLTGK